jgi:hypothetical protein
MSTLWADDQPRRAPRAWSYRIRGAWAVLCGRKVPVSLRTAALGTSALAAEAGRETRIAAMAASEAIETLGGGR